MTPQISVLDAGGQYCHLIARRVRELGVYADVQPSDVAAEKVADRKGLIISGGPASVYETGSPQTDPQIYSAGPAVLGICYGLQLMARALGGEVAKGDRGEYGKATIRLKHTDGLFSGLAAEEPVWMSHRDQVAGLPPGFTLTGETTTCPIAAISDSARRLYGVQFHPEVVHTRNGRRILENFVFQIAGCTRDWDPAKQLPEMERQIRESAAGRKVLFFASGGVDSTVASALCVRALGSENVHAVYVDTGLMRAGETEFVRETFDRVAHGVFEVVDRREQFLAALSGVTDPEKKRHIIGEEFVRVQEQILDQGHFLDGNWILGQGTIYPDTIESGGTQKSELIKTHHNRVAGIQKLIAEKRLIEPVRDLYKDEVRALGRALGLPDQLLDRHPFPGPGLAIRCLCAEHEERMRKVNGGWIAGVRSVGVQGDSRTYRSVWIFGETPTESLLERAGKQVNELREVNRAISLLDGVVPLDRLHVRPATLSAERMERLRRADAIVRRLSADSGFERDVWQFPVVLIPLGSAEHPDSVVLRPIHSVDGMTASVVLMQPELLDRMAREILGVGGIAAVFYDVTNKPPATIEWE